MVPILDLKAEYQELRSEIDAAVSRVLASGYFVGGPEVEALEAELCQYLGVAQVISVGSGADALTIALRAMGIGAGDEVITTPFTFMATLEAIQLVGAKPVLIDIDPRSFNLDPAHLASALGPRTKAVLPVHLYGQMAPMKEILAFAWQHGLKVLEDAAQAIGARYCIQPDCPSPAGSLGDAGAFSFYPSKNLGAYGDGGFIATNNSDLASEARLLASHGQQGRYHHVRAAGYTSRLDALQAAILRVKLPHLEGWNQRRREIAKAYDQGLKHQVQTPYHSPDGLHVYHQYTLRTPEREALIHHLKSLGISSSIHYPTPAHLQPAYQDLAPKGSLPQAEQAALEVLCLPIYPQMVDKQVDEVIGAIGKFEAG
jgi:dTDP-4-amino-4,6-dideoxygalactose transaminase